MLWLAGPLAAIFASEADAVPPAQASDSIVRKHAALIDPCVENRDLRRVEVGRLKIKKQKASVRPRMVEFFRRNNFRSAVSD